MIPKSSITYGHQKNNFLEFLSMAINVFLAIMDTIQPHPCVLALGNSTLAIGWLFNTSKLRPNEPCHMTHLFVAHLLAAYLQHT
jgi:hypothetical protein